MTPNLGALKTLQLNEMEMQVNKIKVAAILLPFLLTACASPSNGESNPAVQVLQGINQGLGKVKEGLEKASTTAGTAAAKESSFTGLMNTGSGEGWPRIAITIHKLPANAYAPPTTQMMGGSIPPSYCMSVSAVVWTDAKTSRTIPEEQFCPTAHIKKRWVGYSKGEFLLWAGTPAQSNHTGPKRTTGPTPPRLLFPEGSKYGNFPNSNASWLFQGLLASIGFDVAVNTGQDRRVWVVTLPGETD
ncbi:MAG: hypothetical protein ACK4S6_17445 [Roseateles asaccharophilus]|uniref:hypothetical protein n=1 Tax=Roseateles asaccharophilus TaxID=582607 RepID=UPI00391C7420